MKYPDNCEYVVQFVVQPWWFERATKDETKDEIMRLERANATRQIGALVAENFADKWEVFDGPNPYAHQPWSAYDPKYRKPAEMHRLAVIVLSPEQLEDIITQARHEGPLRPLVSPTFFATQYNKNFVMNDEPPAEAVPA